MGNIKVSYFAVAVGFIQTILAPLASKLIVSKTGSTGTIPSTECVSIVTPYKFTLIDFSAAPEPPLVKVSSNTVVPPAPISADGGISIWSINCCN